MKSSPNLGVNSPKRPLQMIKGGAKLCPAFNYQVFTPNHVLTPGIHTNIVDQLEGSEHVEGGADDSESANCWRTRLLNSLLQQAPWYDLIPPTFLTRNKSVNGPPSLAKDSTSPNFDIS